MSQVDAFFKAVQKGGKGFSLFRKKLKSTGGTPGSAGSGGFTLDDLLLFSTVRPGRGKRHESALSGCCRSCRLMIDLGW